jgi:GT2 family glycosyltransferase
MEETPQAELQPSEPLVTIIVVSYFQATALRRAIAAIEASTVKDRLQTVVLDMGTHDTTSSWDIEHPEITFLRMPRNFGSSKASNIGLRSAKAEFVLFLDPSVELRPDTVEKLVEALESNPDAAAVAPLLVDDKGEPLPQIRTLPDRDTLWKLWQNADAQSAAAPGSQAPAVNEFPGRRALLTRRSFLKGMSYFDESYGDWGGDLELAFQIRHAGKKAYVLPSAPAVDHGSADRGPNWNNGQLATFAADRLTGVAHFVGKRAGFMPGVLVRVQAIFTVLLRALTFQKPGYNWPLLMSLIGAQKIDGSQGSV